jgi:hypothetical protein
MLLIPCAKVSFTVPITCVSTAPSGGGLMADTTAPSASDGEQGGDQTSPDEAQTTPDERQATPDENQAVPDATVGTLPNLADTPEGQAALAAAAQVAAGQAAVGDAGGTQENADQGAEAGARPSRKDRQQRESWFSRLINKLFGPRG